MREKHKFRAAASNNKQVSLYNRSNVRVKEDEVGRQQH